MQLWYGTSEQNIPKTAYWPASGFNPTLTFNPRHPKMRVRDIFTSAGLLTLLWPPWWRWSPAAPTAWHRWHHCAPQIFGRTSPTGQRCKATWEEVSDVEQWKAFQLHFTVKMRTDPTVEWQRRLLKQHLSAHAQNTSLCLKVKLKERNVVKSTVVTCYIQSLRPCSEEEVEL